MKRLRVFALLMLAISAPAMAQQYVGGGDFLTEHEVDIIRVAQEPNERIGQYLQFARLRLELVKQKLAVEEAGRSVQIHRNLGEYSKIIDAIDMVVDDALLDDVDILKGLDLLVTTEQGFLTTLQAIADSPADDHWRYEFVLADAIDITTDSIELANEDLPERKRQVVEADARDQKHRETTMTPEKLKEVEAAKKTVKAKEEEQKSKRPSLLKKGEKVGEKDGQ
jgi:hypothetical protein